MSSANPPTPHFLEQPTIEFEQFRGGILCAYVKLQDRPAVRDVQPNPDVGVFFYLDEQGFPVGVKFYEPVSGLAAFGVVEQLICGPGGAPEGVDRHVECKFWTAHEVCAAVAAFHEATRRLEGVGVQQRLFDNQQPA